MKKIFLRFISVALIVLIVTACLYNTYKLKGDKEQNLYYPDNDVVTMESDFNDGRMVIVVDTQYNVSTANIVEVIESKFPEVNIILRLQNTPDSSYYTQKSMEQGLLGDIFFCTVGINKDEKMLSENFIDLSDAPFINNYYQNALDGVATNGKIYMLPGFSDFFGIIYDRTLFEEKGWELPHSRDEFIALCKKIKEEEGYQAFMPTLKYGRMAMLLSHAFYYDDIIAGYENYRWLKAYRNGEESFVGHMEPMFEGMKEMFDAGVLSNENFTIDPGVRSAMLYKDHTAAMTMETQAAPVYAANVDSDHKYGMMPFWNSNDENADYLVSAPGFNIYVNKKLESPENAEKLQKVMEILEYLSTPEGQYALMPAEGPTISNVKEMKNTFNGDFMDAVADTIEKGNIFSEVRYTGLANNNDFQVAFREAMIEYFNNNMDIEQAMQHCDEAFQKLKNEVEPKETVYGTASENFTVLETSEFVADILRKEANADIALVLAKQLNYGESCNFFKGDITDEDLKLVTLDYVSGKNSAYNKLVTINLTGEQLLSIIKYPYLKSITTDTRTMCLEYETFSYWVPSNLKIEYAPLLSENKIISVKNMDGTELDLDKTYKVAVWSGCFSNLSQLDYFNSETLEAMNDITPVSEKNSIDIIKAAVIEKGEIYPPDDGRFTICWDNTSEKETE